MKKKRLLDCLGISLIVAQGMCILAPVPFANADYDQAGEQGPKRFQIT